VNLFSVDSFADNAAGGIAVSIFDKSNIFEPHKYGVGFIQDPVQDWAGMVGDFTGASPDFSVTNLVSTTFTGYNGVGVSGGPFGTNFIRPITLRRAGDVFSLTLAGRIEEFADGAPLNTVVIQAIPEPATAALAGVALAVLFGLRRRLR
jgi:hypothetical protein